MSHKPKAQTESFAQLLAAQSSRPRAGTNGQTKNPADKAASAHWQDYASQIKPLAVKSRKATLSAPQQSPYSAIKRVQEQREQQASAQQQALHTSALIPLSHGKSHQLDGKNAQRLKRGKFPAQARIDLHGMTLKQAHAALINFITSSHSSGLRHVLIITGKGLNKENGGVLKEQIPQWLNMSPLRENILAFDYAQQKDGGTGALYVMLRKNRALAPIMP